MNLNLRRKDFLSTGIFGELSPDDESFNFFTLEHAYQIGAMDAGYTFAPKIPPGTYTCKRGLHTLEGMTEPFETFQITDVPGHSNILFHVGNYNKDSSGCVLLGLFRSGNDSIMQSRAAFNLFISKLAGIDSFELEIQ